MFDQKPGGIFSRHRGPRFPERVRRLRRQQPCRVLPSTPHEPILEAVGLRAPYARRHLRQRLLQAHTDREAIAEALTQAHGLAGPPVAARGREVGRSRRRGKERLHHASPQLAIRGLLLHGIRLGLLVHDALGGGGFASRQADQGSIEQAGDALIAGRDERVQLLVHERLDVALAPRQQRELGRIGTPDGGQQVGFEHVEALEHLAAQVTFHAQHGELASRQAIRNLLIQALGHNTSSRTSKHCTRPSVEHLYRATRTECPWSSVTRASTITSSTGAYCACTVRSVSSKTRRAWRRSACVIRVYPPFPSSACSFASVSWGSH